MQTIVLQSTALLSVHSTAAPQTCLSRMCSLTLTISASHGWPSLQKGKEGVRVSSIVCVLCKRKTLPIVRCGTPVSKSNRDLLVHSYCKAWPSHVPVHMPAGGSRLYKNSPGTTTMKWGQWRARTSSVCVGPPTARGDSSSIDHFKHSSPTYPLISFTLMSCSCTERSQLFIKTIIYLQVRLVRNQPVSVILPPQSERYA